MESDLAMTYFDHLNIAGAIVCAVGVIVACRKLPGALLWLIGFAAFCTFGLLFAWSTGPSEKAALGKSCAYRETPSALIIECAIDKKPK